MTTLSPEESHHLSVVLRKRAGDEIRLSDGQGRTFLGVIETLSKKSAVVRLQELLPAAVLNGRLLFAQALLKGEKMEFVLEKAVELGVATFSPFLSSRTVVEWKPGSDKIHRWRKIAEAASKQCGRSLHMKVDEPVSFEALVAKAESEVKIVFWEEATESLRLFFGNRAKALQGPTQTVAILIGPEGGFSKDEIDFAVRHGFAKLSLGPFVLRAETAALTAISLIQYELGNI